MVGRLGHTTQERVSGPDLAWTLLGRCEVVDKPCIWVGVMAQAEATNNLAGLKTFIPAPDRSLKGTSSYVNFYLGRDSRPRSKTETEPAVTPPAAPAA